MIKNIQRTWFEVWGQETAQNKFLKGLLALLLGFLVIETIALVLVSIRKPILIAVSNTQSQVLLPQLPSQELLSSEAKRVISAYATARHTWEWNQIEAHLRDASRYVDSDFEKAFKKATAEQIKIAKDKKVSQIFYVSEIQVNIDTKTAKLSGDRILVIEGLRATNPMNVEIGFRHGARTVSNPEGIYVTSEKLVTN